jgi:hypothetical protein
MATNGAALKREILDLEKAYWEAMKAADADTLHRLTADEFTMTMGEGISSEPNDSFVEMMTSGDMHLKSYRLDDANAVFRELGTNVALLAYKGHSTFERNGETEEADYNYSTTWVKKGKSWQAAAGSAVRVEAARAAAAA